MNNFVVRRVFVDLETGETRFYPDAAERQQLVDPVPVPMETSNGRGGYLVRFRTFTAFKFAAPSRMTDEELAAVAHGAWLRGDLTAPYVPQELVLGHPVEVTEDAPDFQVDLGPAYTGVRP